VSRRLSVVTCFYRTCVIDAVLEASPAAYLRRPPVPNESPTLGLSQGSGWLDCCRAVRQHLDDANVSVELGRMTL
jgi:hypothetical protein